MFDFLSRGHLLVIGLAAFFIFGPERLPTLARDAARGLRRVREALTAAREQLGDEIGDDLPRLGELDLSRYDPRSLVREHLLSEDRPDASARDRASHIRATRVSR